MWVYLDIETTPPFDRPVDPSKVKADGRYTDPKKIEADKVKKAYQQWGNLAKDRTAASVFAICAAVDDGPINTVVNASQEHCLRALDTWMSEHAPFADHPILCAYNGVSFDFPVLAARAAKYGLPRLARRLMPRNSRYGDETHRDPFVALGHEGSMHDWADFFDIEYTPDPDWLYENWARPGRNEFVVNKCQEDVRVLRELTKRLLDGGLMEVG